MRQKNKKWKKLWPMSEEHKRKISESHKNDYRYKLPRPNRGWEMCHFWKWWVSSKNELDRKSLNYRNWRKYIFTRDNFTCKKCNISWWKLNAHHINNFSEFEELRFDINNWITLCESCHRTFHCIYWRYNNTKEQLYDYLNN